MKPRLAIVATHPIQYYSPWFRYIQEAARVDLRVYYLWDFGVSRQTDPGFGVGVQWDVPLLDGYTHEFIPNVSRRPGTSSFFGINNPGLPARLESWNPDAALFMAYNYFGIYKLLFSRLPNRIPLLFRGDSHRIAIQPSLRESLRRRVISRILSRFRAVLSVGGANHDYYVYHGIPADRIFRSPHAVDNDRFLAARDAAAGDAAAWRRELGIQPHEKVVLFLGKLQRLKCVDHLIDAFRRAAVRDSVLLIVGDGAEAGSLRAAAATAGRVLFAPFQNQSLVPRTLMAADLVVLPSSSESWGLVLNEAMCMGKGIVASDRVGAARDLIEEGRNGRVYPFGDVNALSAILREALANGDLLRDWGRASAERIHDYSYARASEGLYKALAYCDIATSGDDPG